MATKGATKIKQVCVLVFAMFVLPMQAAELGSVTLEHIGRLIEVRAFGKVLMRARLRTSIEGGTLQIANSISDEEMKELASRLPSGAFKIDVEVMPD